MSEQDPYADITAKLSEVIATGTEAEARQFIMDHFKEFPQATQDTITVALLEEALEKQNQTEGLAAAFRKEGFDFKQIDRQGDVALFSKTKGRVESFEVVIVQKHKEYEIAGNIIPAHEAMPSSEQWGAAGWS